jgi:hypothetical protein
VLVVGSSCFVAASAAAVVVVVVIIIVVVYDGGGLNALGLVRYMFLVLCIGTSSTRRDERSRSGR